MKFTFYKYHGTGNDFVLIDDREERFPQDDVKLIAKICERRFGVGADGLMLLRNAKGFDFKMVYFNSDGQQSSMCGNGGRCIVKFAELLGIIKNETTFVAIDGAHDASILKDGTVSLKMLDVAKTHKDGDAYVLDTGSPHYVTFVDDVQGLDVFREGRAVRNSERYRSEGINVNFLRKNGTDVEIRTYERGVEAETYSCGTGVTAGAIATYLHEKNTQPEGHYVMKTQGGTLLVDFLREGPEFEDIWLTGPAEMVFKGELVL